MVVTCKPSILSRACRYIETTRFSVLSQETHCWGGLYWPPLCLRQYPFFASVNKRNLRLPDVPSERGALTCIRIAILSTLAQRKDYKDPACFCEGGRN